MQTFLPFENFTLSAKVLDNKRLGKQRVEVLQILNTLRDGSRWGNHPAVLMWKGHEEWLVTYGLIICKEWRKRGFKDTCFDKIAAFKESLHLVNKPIWLGREDFHRSHRSNLLRKNFEFYSKYFVEPTDLPYVWPVKKEDLCQAL